MKKLLTICLCFTLLFSLLTFPGFAENNTEPGETEKTEDLTWYGYQNQVTVEGAETVSVRAIAEIANVDDYTSLSFRVTTVKKGEMDLPVTTVYKKLTAAVAGADGTTFEDILPKTDGNLLSAVILKNIKVTADAEMTITPLATRKDGTTVSGDTVILRKPAGEATFTPAYDVTFRGVDNTEISTVRVTRGENAALPTPPTGSYYTASKEDYAKLFNVMANQTITLDTVATSTYTSGQQWINSQDGGATAAKKWNIDFTTGGWKLTQPPIQTAGAYFTMYGNYAKLSMRFWVNQGDTCAYNIYVDDILVKVFELDATDAKIGNVEYQVLGTNDLTAGMHTIKVVAVKPAQIMAMNIWKGPNIKEEGINIVTYKDADGNVLGTATVKDGETARLPSAPSGYYWTCNMADLANITEYKDVILGKVATSDYAAYNGNSASIQVNQTPDAQKEAYSVVKGGNPGDQSWGLVLYKAGQYVEFKADIAGTLGFGGNCGREGQHFVLGLYVDGVLYKTLNIDTPQSFNITAETNLPAGEHTIRIEVLAATYDEGGVALAPWAGITWTAIYFQEKAAAAASEG